ncbi:sterol 3-beta-glucosyltransferase UGT80B1-like isoform X2 [Panicum virgatum]|uniref:sterol 3-beta-glucosyltransferase UGT80B1-like isoform X2 n=1 Tax=Panicum virgatum TaxID=38727 RepID=UPI0019D50DEF|nr:sterol 3-beta-glucosyltransferase UGT80B1-like isoform X2 [Panicum virgatum]
MAGGGGRPRAVFMAFGTRGDVFPVAALAAAFARDQQQYAVVFITHSAHRSLAGHLAASNVRCMPVSSPPVLAAEQVENISCGSQSNHGDESFSSRKMVIQVEHRKECLSSLEEVFGDDPSINGDFIVINFFALVSWTDIIHWMWALFTESWGSWRSNCLNLSPIPFTDPVTNLPLWHMREESTLLLYGFSKEIVECPGYWPSSAHACGFWFLPTAWQFSCDKCLELSRNMNSSLGSVLCAKHSSMEHFLVGNSYSSRPVFVGLSSIGSMGFLRNPKAFLMVLKAAIESTDYRFILFSSGYQPLDSAIQSIASSAPKSSEAEASSLSDDSTLLFNDRLFCFSGSIPYSWLFPRCAVAIHHAGSGSTAAALLAGIPQVVCPFLLDQFYWAERLHWLGVAPAPLQRQHLIPDNDDPSSIHNAAEVLRGAIKSALFPEIKAQATSIADRLSFEDGIGEALRILKERVLIQGQT